MNEVTQIIIAIATVVYTVGTFLLWSSTRQSIRISRDQQQQLNTSYQASFIQEVVRSHRELYSLMVTHPTLLKEMAAIDDTTGENVIRQYFLTMMVNHTEYLYMVFKLQQVDTGFWKGIERDMKEMFSKPTIRKHWNVIKYYHSRDFVDFIDNLLYEDNVCST